ncbi:MAG: hypothetical protein AAGG38_10240 [Planctomycetota bacterium]
MTGLLLAAGFAGWSMLHLDQARTQQRAAATQLASAQRYTQTIQKHREAPTRIADREMQLTLLARLVEHAADEAGVSRQKLDRIWPQPPRRVSDSPYLRKSTQIVVREITLPQAVTFLHQLTNTRDVSLSLDTLRLIASREAERSNGSPETWTVEAAVSELLYQPPAARHRVAQRN